MKNFILFCIALFSFLTISCKTTEYIPVEKVKTEYISSKDTVIIKDSVFVNQYIKGDTVYRDRDRWHNRIVIKNDTIVKVDSIPVIKEVEKPVYVEKKLNIVQKTAMYTGTLTIFLLILFVLVKCIKSRLI